METISHDTRTAWSLIGAHGQFRAKGGRATYEHVSFNCDTPGELVSLSRINPDCTVTTRRVDPDFELEVLWVEPGTDPEAY